MYRPRNRSSTDTKFIVLLNDTIAASRHVHVVSIDGCLNNAADFSTWQQVKKVPDRADFPSIGAVDPTIIANALRVADKIKQRLGTKDQPS